MSVHLWNWQLQGILRFKLRDFEYHRIVCFGDACDLRCRCLVLGSSADGCLRLVDVAAASQSRRLHITAPPPLPPPPHHMTDSRPPDGSASPSAGPQHEVRTALMERHNDTAAVP